MSGVASTPCASLVVRKESPPEDAPPQSRRACPPRTLYHRAILTTLDAAGVRVSELCPLQGTDIDSARLGRRGQQGKGQHERYVMLALPLLPFLRQYGPQEPPRPWLVPGPPGHVP